MNLWFLLAKSDDVEHADVMAMNWLPAVTSLIVFLLAFGFLAKVVWPKITKGLDDRERKIRETIAAADKAKEDAEKALAEYQENLVKAREEANAMIAQAKSDAKAAGEELRRSNDADLAEIKQRATREIESAKRSAITELHAEASMLATAIASKILQREISAQDQQKLVDETLGEMGRLQDN
ncbi:MAG: F0F1 ATP synthase subunit B [Planctomycetota bacterium]|nr:F0F1 ATP synthase subunit B [Planctomycetota bacterium]